MPSPIVSRELFEDFLLYSINFEFVMYGPLDRSLSLPFCPLFHYTILINNITKVIVRSESSREGENVPLFGRTRAKEEVLCWPKNSFVSLWGE